jgi:TonB family protein
MRGSRRKLAAAASLLLAAMAGCAAFAQNDSPRPPVVRVTRVPIAVTSKADVAIVNFFNPVYPPLARSARVTGDVVLEVGIHKDGSIESVSVVSGHPLLTQAALDSAQHSQFECRGCKDDVTPTSLSYSFQLVAGPDFPCPEGNGLQVIRSQNRVSVVAEPGVVHPYFASMPVPSAKCLYLWACGSRWGGEDYYYARVRSKKCLNLWNCGRRLREPFATCKKLHRQLS